MFVSLLKSNFGDSVTAITPPLEPRLKSGQDATTAPSPPSENFETPVGNRRVPREKNPRRPNYEMIKDARKGILSGFLRSGNIFRASEFVGIVNPKTAIITLNDIYDFETRCLAAIDGQPIHIPPITSISPFKKTTDKGSDNEKTLRNLFFISLAPDELPSFHFWTKPGDLDPVTAGEPTDWGKLLDENPPSPATTAKIEILENERKGKGQREAEGQQNAQNKQPLEFLNQYNDNSVPASGRELTDGQPANDLDPTSQIGTSSMLAQSPPEAEVLLQFNRGGMYLREFTHKALYAMACWMIENEQDNEEEEEDVEDEENKGQPRNRDMYLDILEPEKDLREEKIVSVSRASNRNFLENIKPFFGRPDNKFRVRSTRYQSSWNIDSGFDSGGVGDLKYDLKLVRPNVGYCYCSAYWHQSGKLKSNSQRFEKALEFLFDWKLSAHPNSNHLSLDIPGHGSFDLARNTNVVVDASIQEIFAKLSETSAGPDSHPVEIFVRDVVDETDASDFLATGSPRYGTIRHEKTSKDLPSIHPRLLTVSETNNLQEQLRILKASVVETDGLQERLGIAEEELSEMRGLKERLKIAEDKARLKSSCPFCPQDWAGMTKQQQQDHLKLHQKSIVHQPASQNCPHPNCPSWLGENRKESTYEAISEHLRHHIELEHADDGICEYQNCHTNLYALTAEQQDEHESIHRDNQKTEEERDQLLGQVRYLEVARLQDAANERDRLQGDLTDITEQRDSLQNRVEELERQLEAASNPDEGTQTKGLEPETELDEDPEQSRQLEAPKKLRYCNICLKSVDKLSPNAKVKHADKCETNVSEFFLLSPAEAKAEREKRNKSRGSVKRQAQEGPKEVVEAPNTGMKRKRQASAKAASLESQQDEAEDTNEEEQPEASKGKGRKTTKRKNSAFKPPKEDESEDEEPESSRKKPKLRAKAAKTDKETAPTRKSTRGQDIYQEPEEEEEEDHEEEDEGAYDEPTSSAKGAKRRKKTPAVTTVSKKAKTKK